MKNHEPVTEPDQDKREDQAAALQSPREYLEDLLRRARAAAGKLASLPTSEKDRALQAMAEGLEKKAEEILAANAEDLAAFGQDKGKDKDREKDTTRTALADRLTLTPERIAEMAEGIQTILRLPDPVGQAPKLTRRPNGMLVGKVRVPIGVIGIIYESRPNVTADSAALCLKSGNVAVLRGGTEALHSNRAIATVLGDAAEQAGLPAGVVTFIDRPERDVARLLLKQDGYVDLIIPRGGESLMKTVTEESLIPVLKHDKGVCHIYVDADADLAMAKRICLNAKVQRPATCNAMETLLVHEKVSRTFLPGLAADLKAATVEVRGCPKTCQIVPEAKPATDRDYGTEFLSLILAVKVVKNMDEALEHIAQYGSRHTEAILTADYGRAMRFLREVDAGVVMVNASTRLNDGYEFGLGAEIGISTARIHARGPMGLEELTCFKYVVYGSGQIRE